MPESAPRTVASELAPAHGRRRTATYNLLFNYVSIGVTLANGIFLVPWYLSHFDLATYGAWLASGNVLSMIATLDMGLNLVFSQRLATLAGQGDGLRFREAAGAGILLTITCGALIGLAGLACAPFVPAWINAPQAAYRDLALAFAMAAAGAVLVLIQQGASAIAQAWQEPIGVGVASSFGALAGIAATIAGLFLGLGVVALGFGMMVRGLAGALVVAAVVVARWRARGLSAPPVVWKEVRSLALSTSPVFGSRIAGSLLTNSEAAIVAVLVSPTAAAVLALTSRLFSAVGLILGPIGSAAFAGLATLAAGSSKDRLRTVVLELFQGTAAVASLLVAGALALNKSFVSLWVGPGQFGGTGLSIAVGFAAMISARANLTQITLTALGQVSAGALAALVEVAVRLLLVVGLVQWLGLAGMPLAAAGASLLILALMTSRMLRSRLSTGVGPEAASPSWAGMPVTLLLLGAGVLLGLVSPRPDSWAWFVAEGAACGAALLGLALVASPYMRALLRTRLNALRA